MLGINHKILRVDLNTLTCQIDEHDDAFYRKYLGGRGFALYYMLREMNATVDPLSPENMLVFATSIIVGAPGPAIPRLIVCAKSPLTGGFGESEAGGFWAPELKKAGYDAIVITGKAPQPVYLWIKDGQVEFRDAGHLWGKDTGTVQQMIRAELGHSRVRVAQTGPAGENLVKYANITNELGHFNGRNGLGAVMGSKNLRAIAVLGSRELPLANKVKVHEIARWAATEGMKNPLAQSLHELGTSALVTSFNAAGVLPTRNWTKATFAEADAISGETMRKTIVKKSKGCFACAIRCKRVVEVVEDDIWVDPQYGGPEYETLGSIGSIVEVGDLRVIAKANELCNRYTLDTISTGMSIAFAMECYENGLLDQDACDGLDLKFGNAAVVLQLIEKIARREGIGDLLAEGSYRAARQIGKGADKYVHAVKKQEVPMHDPRLKTGVGLQYALADYGADHLKAAHDSFYASPDAHGIKTTKALGIYEPVNPVSLDEEKVRLFVVLDTYWSMIDALGVCCFGYVPRGPVSLEMLVELVQAVTGTDISLGEMMRSAERTTHMARVFNIRAGFSAADDTLPEKFFENFADGPNKGTGAMDREQFASAVRLRYEIMGWNPETTEPQRARLEELGIQWILPERQN